jgi:hypothetical protein
MKHKLNLAVLRKRDEEMNEEEMKDVRAGAYECTCMALDCLEGAIIALDIQRSTYYRVNCSCGSIWSAFGLAWG